MNTPASEPKTTKQHAKILGHSACSVIRALGKAGVKGPKAKEILAKHDITMPPASISVQLGFGRSGKKECAPLTADQIQELTA